MAQSTLTDNAVQICRQLRNNENSRVETVSWALVVMQEELCDEVSELSLGKHGLHFKVLTATAEQLELAFMDELATKMQVVSPALWSLSMALLDSRDGRRRRMSDGSALKMFEQDEMDLGELGGDDLRRGRDDEESSDGGGFEKHPKKRQRRAGERNVALLRIKSVAAISIY
ncbi:hypothetical protein PAXRUDRAFT_836529 [Paxillus rubicundulus Ve08.2h10]|uniref:Uncharacterized protein n=1 Tax=Paxillus rubicundulus Ve08.2h10 TaxID=930991 RepID=A0A0D0D5I4_9AGAM|nr:hypothetical protein PAXRUDRAFT_836529 [Paxillus rubicundulus Ve08.2h10]